MSYKWERKEECKFKVQGTVMDRRAKLTQEQKDAIAADKTTSCVVLAKQYGVSKRLIQFIRKPESHIENLKRRQERGGSKIYYDKEKHRKQMREYRKRKQQLFILGELGCLPIQCTQNSKESQEKVD